MCVCYIYEWSPVMLSRSIPVLLPNGLGVIPKSVIYELVLNIVHTERTVMFTSLQLFVDGNQTVAQEFPSVLHLTYINTAFEYVVPQCLIINFHSIDVVVVLIPPVTYVCFI